MQAANKKNSGVEDEIRLLEVVEGKVRIYGDNEIIDCIVKKWEEVSFLEKNKEVNRKEMNRILPNKLCVNELITVCLVQMKEVMN